MIKIAVVSYNNEAPSTSNFAVFGSQKETIGRNIDNFLILPDPKHFVSRTQAKVWSAGGRHFLHNLSLANPILVNGKEIPAESDQEIQAGDEIQIGLYVLQAELIAEVQEEVTMAAPTPSPPVAAVVEPEAKPADVDHIAPEVQADEQKANTGSPARAPSRKLPPNMQVSNVQPPQFLLRPDVVTGQASLPEQAEVVVDTVDVASTVDAANMDDAANTADVASAVDVANTADVASTDVANTAVEAVSESPAPAAPAAKPKAANSKPLASNAELMQAFLNGAGLPELTLSAGLTVDLMETLGKLVASSVQGAMEELSQRALLKREVKAEVTMVVLRENNPLKFFPDSKTVLTQMLRKKMPGFMAPAEAMEDSFFDIRAHQMGVAAGTRAVMNAVLEALQPSNVEEHLNAPGLLEQAMPARRKAAMWDQFGILFENIYSGRKDDFQAMFGKEFLAAYQKEVERAEVSHLAF
ncbi:type VI secretion system-associated FHA domain protein TagH [Undibacterium sp. Di26W]|uniref:type VI secretion system-associated FHA domain protein TagH n=1 Tax=Undibacterium sp. Di26W TaxID=3413035 RepID=UPI003BF43068